MIKSSTEFLQNIALYGSAIIGFIFMCVEFLKALRNLENDDSGPLFIYLGLLFSVLLSLIEAYVVDSQKPILTAILINGFLVISGVVIVRFSKIGSLALREIFGNFFEALGGWKGRRLGYWIGGVLGRLFLFLIPILYIFIQEYLFGIKLRLLLDKLFRVMNRIPDMIF